jgi:hypothetical protein
MSVIYTKKPNKFENLSPAEPFASFKSFFKKGIAVIVRQGAVVLNACSFNGCNAANHRTNCSMVKNWGIG